MRLRSAASALSKVSRSSSPTSRSADDVLQTLGMHVEGRESVIMDDDGGLPEGRLATTSSIAHRPVHSIDLAESRTALIRRQSNSKFAAQLRDLATTLSGNRPGEAGPHSIVLSGVDTREDSSVVAASLAVTCAATGFQVLLVDANLTRPKVHSMFGVSNEYGLSDLLGSSNPPNFLPQATSIPNLAVIAAGSRVSNYASLLSRQRVRHRLDPIASAFDYIIIDASGLPASLLARVALGVENVVIAVKRHVSSIRALESTMRLLTDEGVQNSSILILE